MKLLNDLWQGDKICFMLHNTHYTTWEASVAFIRDDMLQTMLGAIWTYKFSFPRYNKCFATSIIAGPSKVLPRCALPKYLTEELQKHIPNAIFSSNPCRFDSKLVLLFVPIDDDLKFCLLDKVILKFHACKDMLKWKYGKKYFLQPENFDLMTNM